MRPIDADAFKKYIDAQEGRPFIGCTVGEAMKILIDEQPTIQCEPQWILITERLPRDGSWNIFTDGKNISVERYKADAIDHFFPNGRWFQLEDVIAWMPLPAPYLEVVGDDES